ncbi:amino acid synthesis family protein [Nonomuraea sp. NPDC049480]|uniref:amino acid synthesis family protein n=1 Tax=Nonomuraea sp. NPDC049480 TaxID=3364353 RepID=UPI0037891FD9
MSLRIRKIVTFMEDLEVELGRPVNGPVRRAAAAAVLTNPWAGRGYAPDLQPEVLQLAPKLATALSGRLIDALGGREAVEAFGKAAIVGLDGEIEHGAALIHTPYFGNLFRELVDGSSIIVFSDDRLQAGEPLTVPMWHKVEAATRSHYQTISVRVAEAPRPDEIVIVAAASSGGRPNARIGDRTSDPRVRLADIINDDMLESVQ